MGGLSLWLLPFSPPRPAGVGPQMCYLLDMWHSPTTQCHWGTQEKVLATPQLCLPFTSFPLSPLRACLYSILPLQQEYNVRLLYTHSERCQRIMTKVVGGSTASRDQFSSPGCQEEGGLASNGFATAMRVKLPPKPAGH